MLQRRLHSGRARHADRPEPRLHQLDRPDRPRARARYAAVVLLRRRTSATPGYLRFTAACALGFGVLAWISDGALPDSLGDSPVVVDPAWDAPRRAALAGLHRRRGALAGRPAVAARGSPPRSTGRASPRPTATLVFGALAWGGGSLGAVSLLVQLAVVSAAIGGVFAAMILGHWYLVTPKLPEAPLILLARVLLGGRRGPGRAVRGLDRRPAPGRPTSRRSRRWSGRGPCSSGCA